jgi:hypothetical protein
MEKLSGLNIPSSPNFPRCSKWNRHSVKVQFANQSTDLNVLGALMLHRLMVTFSNFFGVRNDSPMTNKPIAPNCATDRWRKPIATASASIHSHHGLPAASILPPEFTTFPISTTSTTSFSTSDSSKLTASIIPTRRRIFHTKQNLLYQTASPYSKNHRPFTAQEDEALKRGYEKVDRVVIIIFPA